MTILKWLVRSRKGSIPTICERKCRGLLLRCSIYRMSLPDIMCISKREITIMLITTTCPCPCPYNKIKGVYQTISTSNICIISNIIFTFPPLPPPSPAASNQINPPPPYSTAQRPYRPPDSANPPRPLPHPYPHSNSACAESFCADPSS
jgi:hypothetical protein